MSLTGVDENELLLPLHDGVHEAPRWATFLARLRRRVRADRVRLAVRRAGARHRAPLLFDTLPGGEAGDGPASWTHLRPGRVYAADELGVAWDGGGAFARVMHVEETRLGASGWLVAQRGREGGREDFGAADSALMSALAPHLVVALRGFAALERVREQALAADAGLARLGVGWVRLDADARILDADPQACALLREGLGMERAVGERLRVLAGGEAGREMARAEALFAADPGRMSLALPLSDDEPRLDMLLARPDGEGAMAGYLRSGGDASPGRPDAIARLFGLPPSEARLAAALAGGVGIAEAAAALGLTVETARNYSKRVYARTGARGQADLARIILGGVAALA